MCANFFVMMPYFKTFTRYIPLGITLIFFSCGNKSNTGYTSDIDVLNSKILSDARHSIHTGDIILRSGRDFTSYRIRELSQKDKTYSHAGIALVKDTNVFVYHVIPPDLDESKADSTVRLEPLEQFAKPSKCFGFGIVRYKLSDEEIIRSMHYLDSIYQKKVPFDRLFDLSESNTMYCSEMVDNSLRYATQNRITLARRTFTQQEAKRVAAYFRREESLVMTRDYIPIDNIHIHPDCTVIYNYVFLK